PGLPVLYRDRISHGNSAKMDSGSVLFLSNGYWTFPATRTIYQGPMKVICGPGLNCYSCPAATTYCPIGAIQQLFGGVRLALDAGQFYIGLYVIGTLGVIGGTVGRMVCGWACPFGLFQELLYKISSPKLSIWTALRYLKYGLLLFTVLLLPLFAIDKFSTGDPWFCKYICPGGTLEAGLPMIIMQQALREKLGWIFLVKVAILVVFTVWSGNNRYEHAPCNRHAACQRADCTQGRYLYDHICTGFSKRINKEKAAAIGI
uniref:4Fe-4S binding protein n=1 Tax=Candidatus Electrothrix sp. TaxID=2170559 RepID=UPI004057C10A